MKKLITLLVLLVSLVACQEPTYSNKRAQISGEIIQQFAKSMKKKGFYAVGSGGGQRHGITKEIAVTLQVDKLMDIELARSFIVDAVDEIVEITNSKENISQFFNEFPVPASLFFIAIIGLDTEKGNLQQIESVYQGNGRVCYCAITPDPRYDGYIHALEETFEEAKKQLSVQCKN